MSEQIGKDSYGFDDKMSVLDKLPRWTCCEYCEDNESDVDGDYVLYVEVESVVKSLESQLEKEQDARGDTDVEYDDLAKHCSKLESEIAELKSKIIRQFDPELVKRETLKRCLEICDNKYDELLKSELDNRSLRMDLIKDIQEEFQALLEDSGSDIDVGTKIEKTNASI